MKSFLICFVAGVVVSLLTIYVLYMIDTHGGEIVPLNTPQHFGDIKIWLGKPPRDGRTYNISNMLCLAKDDVPFLQIYRNKAGEVFKLAVYDERKRIIFSMDAATEPGKWEHFAYDEEK